MEVLLKRSLGFKREVVLVDGYIRPSGEMIKGEVVFFLEDSDPYDYIVRTTDELGIPHEFLVHKHEIKELH